MTEEERAWEGELRLQSRGVLKHGQARSGGVVVPHDTKEPLAVVAAYRANKLKLNPLRAMKNRMMREGNLSSRQWRKFRKRMNRKAREALGE